MDLVQIAGLISLWADQVGQQKFDYSPDAKVITGDYKLDIQLHNFEKASGIEIQLSDPRMPRTITGYKVVDEKKWAWFLLELA